MSAKIDTISKRIILIIIGIWLVVGISVVSNNVLIYNYTFAKTDEIGDGIGTIADIGILKAQPFLQNDKTKIVAPLMVVPKPIDDNWWVAKQFLALFFSPDNVYDVLCILFWLLNFLAGFYLFQSLKLNDFGAVIFGLILAGLEVYSSRITGHLTMAAIFIPILQITYAIKITESPSIKNIIFFSILSFACFLSNEYYGYFGFIFSFVLLLFYFILNFKRIKEIKIGVNSGNIAHQFRSIAHSQKRKTTG